ncbi:VanZ family protein [Olivibacter sp. SDN3]|uniref:VanZ family protein n=1 Tax=Olivibacter sp. SDN3 TaxID=2764720 RepID=UPI001650EDD5|nr:VanZ family protein [Olivibacter sp. SDN3]QNL52035.1 VanZ family protein [Olivibacter sp. SDN3]
MENKTIIRIKVWLWRFWAFFYFSLIIYVVFLASRRPSPTLGEASAPPNFSPFGRKWFGYTHGWNTSDLYLDLFGNIVMFIPYALFLYIAFNVRSYWVILFSAFSFSLFIESTQYFTGIGYADIDDLICNTLGALIGILVIDGVKLTRYAKK